MDTPKAILAGFGLIAVAILINGFMDSRYMISKGFAGDVIVMDMKSGSYRYCNYNHGCEEWLDVTK